MRVTVESVTSAAFSPFGELVQHAGSHPRCYLDNAVLPTAEAVAPRLWVNRLDDPRALPLTITVLERHQFSPQTFIPLEVGRYLVVVAPSDGSGAPALAEARAFILAAGCGIAYALGTWHAGMTVLDQPARFAVLMWTTGDAALDTEFTNLPVPLTVTPD